MKYLNPIDQEALRLQFTTASPFPFFKIDNFLEKKFAEAVLASFPSYTEARKKGLEFAGVNEYKKVQVTDARTFPPALRKLNNVLSSRKFLDLMSYVTNIPKLLADDHLVGGGLHQTAGGGHLDVHVDFNYIEERQLHRRLNILIYFNKIWEREWGGNIELWDKHVTIRHHSFEPVFNRCVVFETSDISYHGVDPVHCPPDVTRKSFAAYYYTREAPAHYHGETHSTIFRARPNEKLKGYVEMPMERAKQLLVKYVIPENLLPTLSKIKQKLKKL